MMCRLSFHEIVMEGCFIRVGRRSAKIPSDDPGTARLESAVVLVYQNGPLEVAFLIPDQRVVIVLPYVSIDTGGIVLGQILSSEYRVEKVRREAPVSVWSKQTKSLNVDLVCRDASQSRRGFQSASYPAHWSLVVQNHSGKVGCLLVPDCLVEKLFTVADWKCRGGQSLQWGDVRLINPGYLCSGIEWQRERMLTDSRVEDDIRDMSFADHFGRWGQGLSVQQGLFERYHFLFMERFALGLSRDFRSKCNGRWPEVC